MTLLNLLDPELGAKVRSVVLRVLAVATAVLALLQGVLGVLDTLPHWPWVGVVALFVQAVIVQVARGTSFGNKVVGD